MADIASFKIVGFAGQPLPRLRQQCAYEALKPLCRRFVQFRPAPRDFLLVRRHYTIDGSTIDGSAIDRCTISGSTIPASTVDGSAILGSAISGSAISGSTIPASTVDG